LISSLYFLKKHPNKAVLARLSGVTAGQFGQGVFVIKKMVKTSIFGLAKKSFKLFQKTALIK